MTVSRSKPIRYLERTSSAKNERAGEKQKRLLKTRGGGDGVLMLFMPYLLHH